jgi:hypothetical protein
MIKIKNENNTNRPRWLITLVIIATFITLPAHIASAQEESSLFAQNFRSEDKKSNFTTGAIVTGVPNKSDHVQLATQDNANQLIGVIDNYPLLSLSNGDKNIPVVLSGSTTVFVSNINGDIKSGDKITASPILGVGMRATASGQIVGTATADFKKKEGTPKVLADRDGTNHTIYVQKLPIQVGVAYYEAPGNSYLPPSVQNLADSIAGKPVSIIRILISMAILILAFTFTVVLTYSSTRSTIAALGRNPLGSKQIIRGQYRSILIAIITVSGALLATYLLLIL